MSENNELKTIKTLDEKPFKHFCVTIGELPTSFIDSMSYYELAAWLCQYLESTVIPAVNENAEAVSELQNLFIDLKSYVDHYFDNLDVQNEINTKLDAMVASGEFERLFANYVTPQISAINTKVENYNSETNTRIDNLVENGITPLTASSTDEMTLTDRIYVNTSNGEWYYYSDGDWVSGGEYQSVGLGNKEVHYDNLDDELQDSIDAVIEPTDITTLNVGLVNADGSISGTTSTIYAYYEFAASPYDTYKVHMRYTTSYPDSAVAIQFLNDSTVVSNILKTGVEVESNYFTKIFVVPNGVNKVRINTALNPNMANIGDYILKVNKYEVNNISKRQLDETMQSFFTNEYEEVTPTSFITSAFMRYNDMTAYAQSDVLSLEVNPHEVYRISIKQVDANPIVSFTVPNKTTTLTIGGNDYIVSNWAAYIQGESSRYQFENYEFEIPEYCQRIYISKYKTDTSFKIEKCTGYKISGSDVIQNYNKIGFSKLIAVGDSITEKNYRAAYNYLDYIKTDIPSLTIQNLGVSGTGYKASGNPFYSRIASISNYNLNSDVIIVMGSVNDIQYVSDDLGQMGDTTSATIYGSMYKFFNDLFTEFNGVRIGCISPINWKNPNTTLVNQYLKALEDTCKYFNVPYLDLFHETNLRPNDASFLSTYYLSDGAGHDATTDTGGVHPNSAGHKLFYGRIKEFINKL